MIDIEIEDANWSGSLPQTEALVRASAEATLQNLSRFSGGGGAGPSAMRTAAPPPSASLTVLLTDDETVRGLNARFRDQDKPTNVLSFPAPQNPERFLGDIALAYGVCAREAHEQGKPLAHHLQHLVAHGVLHLLGYDHMSDAEAEEMEGLERAVLAGLGVPDPYSAPSV